LRCEYCHAPQGVSGYRFHLEHIVPVTAGGSDVLSNRALACATCNLAKTDKVVGIDSRTGEETALYDPRTQVWEQHFRWSHDQQTIAGKTPTGRATISTLDMNNELHRPARQLWFTTGWLP
jgi:HNH endonuclease